MHIDNREVEYSPLSMLDEVGRVFFWKGKVYRAIRNDRRDFVITLFSSGLVSSLSEAGVFVSSEITDYALEGCSLVVAHETAQVVSYPHEWSYEMLKQAALTVLNVNKAASQFGYQTKDCHPYNILFFGVTPKYIDFGSLIPVSPVLREHLFEFEEYAKCYLFPLTVWEKGDSFTARRYVQRWKLMATPDAYLAYRLGGVHGIGRRLIQRVWKSHFKLQRMLRELGNPDSSSRWKKFRWLASIVRTIGFPLRSSHIDTQIQSLQKKRRRTANSTWGTYHQTLYLPDGQMSLSARMKRIVQIVAELSPETVTDIAGNQGVVSQAVAGLPGVRRVVCLDYDDEAIDSGFQRVRSLPVGSKLHFAVVDPFYPEINRFESPPETRFQSEVVLALAVTHHLVLTQGYPLEHIFASIRRYATTHVAIEFMPLGLCDSVTGVGPTPPVWYTEDWFRREFERHFALVDVVNLEVNRVLFVGNCTLIGQSGPRVLAQRTCAVSTQ